MIKSIWSNSISPNSILKLSDFVFFPLKAFSLFNSLNTGSICLMSILSAEITPSETWNGSPSVCQFLRFQIKIGLQKIFW